jgi:multidrug efflux system membrane fusion protein
MSELPTEKHRPTAPPAAGGPPTAAEKKRGRRAVLWTLLAVLVLGTAALLTYRSRTAQGAGFRPGGAGAGGYGGGGRRGGFGMAGPLPVVVTAAQKGTINIILEGLGTVTPLATITVTTQISGYLAEVKFTEGQLVKKGDILAVIDPRPYQVALEQAQGQLVQAQAQYKEAQIDLDRYQKLSTQDSISKQQVDAQQALVQQYEGMVKTNQAAVDNATLNLVYCHVTAPVTGRVGLRLVDQGNYVTPNSTSGLVLLTQMKPITVIFSLPEDDIPRVLKRARSKATIQVDAYNRDDTVKLASGTLTTVDNTVDPTTGTFKLRATFPNDDEGLFPNQYVNASMRLDVVSDAIVIPTSAIERGQQGSFVYVVGGDNKVSARPVTLGATEGENLAVTGVKEGESVVVDGADRLKEGMEVVPQTMQQASAKPTPRPAHGDGEHRHWKKPADGN